MLSKKHSAKKRTRKSSSDELASLNKFKKRVNKQLGEEFDGDAPQEVTNQLETNALVAQSVLFTPYRAFGYYTSTVPACVYKSGEDLLIASVVGKHAFYVYDSKKLNLVFMSRFIAEEITWLQASMTGLIYTSLKETNEIVSWNKMHRVKAYKGH